MRRFVRTVIQASMCGALVLLSGSPGLDLPAARPAARVVYNLFATDGYVRLGDGSRLHVFGFIGGREGQSLTYLDEAGVAHTLEAGAPAPTGGSLTEAETQLAGHAAASGPTDLGQLG